MQVHLRGELGEEGRFLDGRIAPADHGDLLAAEEEAVARGARGQAVPEQPLLGLEAQHQALGSGADDDGVGRVEVVAHPHLEGPLTEVHRSDLRREERGAEASRLFAAPHHQLRTHDAVGEAGEVLDLGGQHQLAARLVTRAARLTLDDQGFEVRPGGVDRRGEAGGAGSDDDDRVMAHELAPL